MKRKIKLKKLKKDEEYPRGFCCASNCRAPSDLIDATHKHASVDLPLCDEHWLKLDGDDNDTTQESVECNCSACTLSRSASTPSKQPRKRSKKSNSGKQPAKRGRKRKPKSSNSPNNDVHE